MPRPRKVDNDEILVEIAKMLDAEEEFSSADIGTKVGLSRPTVNRRLKEMDAKDILRVKPYRDASGHRRYTVRVLAKGRKRLERMAAA